MNIKLTSVPVAEPMEAIEFYVNTLGFQELMKMPEANLAIVASPEDPKGTALMLEPIGLPEVEKLKTVLYEKKIPWIVLGTDSVEKEYERLTALGVKFSQEPKTSE